MVLTFTLLAFGALGFSVPKQYLRRYMLFSAVCISSLYFFYTPPPTWDLTRHYQALRILRNYDFKSVVFGNVDSTNEMLREYSDGSRIYLIYAYLIGQFHVDALLPVITGIIIYTTATKIIVLAAEDVGGNIEDWKLSFCFFYLLIMLDFRTISGVRNMMAYVLCSYVLYMDLVRNANKIICFSAYFLLYGLHTSVAMLILLRALVLLCNVMPKWIVVGFSGLIYTFQDYAIRFLSRFSNLSVIELLMRKVNTYAVNGGTEFKVYRGVIHFIEIILILLLYLYVRRNIKDSKKFKKFGDYYLLIIAFTLGAIQQYDIFVRNVMLLYFMVFPFLLLFLKTIVCETPFELNVPEYSKIGFNETVVYLSIYLEMVLFGILYYRGYYTPMDVGFSFFK